MMKLVLWILAILLLSLIFQIFRGISFPHGYGQEEKKAQIADSLFSLDRCGDFPEAQHELLEKFRRKLKKKYEVLGKTRRELYSWSEENPRRREGDGWSYATALAVPTKDSLMHTFVCFRFEYGRVKEVRIVLPVAP